MSKKLEVTESFAEWRRKGIGSSDAAAVMNASPWCTPYKLWELKTGRREPEKASFPMLRGIDLEPHARSAYEELSGIRMDADRMKHKEHDFVRANFDGINTFARLVLEIKCPGRVDHEKAKAGIVPDKYIWQCVHLLAVSRMPVLHYWSFDGQNGELVQFRRDKDREEQLLIEEAKFWKLVTTDTPPRVDVFRTRRGK